MLSKMGLKKYGSTLILKDKKIYPQTVFFVVMFSDRAKLFVQDRHSPSLAAAQNPPILLCSAPIRFSKTF